LRLIAASISIGSPLVVALLAVLALVELGLLAWALLDLARRPADRVAGGSRLLWLLLCLFVQLIGPALYLVVGRVRAASVEAPKSDARGRPRYPPRLTLTSRPRGAAVKAISPRWSVRAQATPPAARRASISGVG